jgi:hypothetical protein
MTDQQHPITPPPELVEKWYEAIDNSSTSWKQQLATRAAQWGADEELKAVCQLLFSDSSVPCTLSNIRAARRPKPPSLKKQALDAYSALRYGPDGDRSETQDWNTLRRALESIND